VTCRLLEINPTDYLGDVLPVLARGVSIQRDVPNLTPQAWMRTRPSVPISLEPRLPWKYQYREPDTNPIEMAFSTINHHVRKAVAQSTSALRDAFKNACATITPRDARNYIGHAGYL